MIRITIPGDPVGKGRPRMTCSGRMYTPAKTKAWERRAATMMAYQAVGVWTPPNRYTPIKVSVWAIARRPKAFSRKKDPKGRVRRLAKPDIDNVAKAVLDAAQKAKVFVDDAQVCELTAYSMYGAIGEEPCVEVTMEEL